MAEEHQDICPKQQLQPHKPIGDCSIDSCLTSCDGPQPRETDMHNSELGLRPYNDTRLLEGNYFNENLKHQESVLFHTTQQDAGKMMFQVEGACSDLSMRVGIGENTGDELEKSRFQNNNKYKLASFSGDIDLNARDEPDAPSHLELNGLSWA